MYWYENASIMHSFRESSWKTMYYVMQIWKLYVHLHILSVLIIIIMFYEVTSNSELTNTEPFAPKGNTVRFLWNSSRLFTNWLIYKGFPGGAVIESGCQYRRHEFSPWVGKILWRRKWQPTPVFLPGKLHGPRRLAGYSPWGCKELDTAEWAHTSTRLIHNLVLCGFPFKDTVFNTYC